MYHLKDESGEASLIAAFIGATCWLRRAQDIQPCTLIATVYSASQSESLVLLNWRIGRAFYSLDVIKAFLLVLIAFA